MGFLLGVLTVLIFYGLGIFKWLLLATILLSWLPLLGIQVDPYNPIIQFLYRVTNPVLAPLRRYGRLGTLDISPIIAFLIIGLIQNCLLDLMRTFVLDLIQILPSGFGRQLFFLLSGTENFISRVIALSITLTIAFAVHEFAHAWTAFNLGDSTARNQGRLTLDPRKHLDILGSIMVLTVGFGWAKPVPVNPNNLRNGPQAGMTIVAAAGPLSNLILAIVAAIPLKLGLIEVYYTARYFPDPVTLFSIFVWLNVLLFFFNLLPIAPLDGFKIVAGLLPYPHSISFRKLEPVGPLILLGLLFLLPGVLNFIIGGPTRLLVEVLI